MKEPNLKPCPFCGGKPTLHYYQKENEAWVLCECGASSGMVEVILDPEGTMCKAIDKWNMRVGDN